MIKLNGTLLLVGAGKMGGAMLSGWLENGLAPGQVLVQDPGPPPDIAAVLKDHAIAPASSFETLAAGADVIVLAVKPQVMNHVLPSVVPHVAPDTLVISVAAGTTVASLNKFLPRDTAIIRTMPNTPSAVGRGITGAFPTAPVTDPQRKLCDALLSAVGAVVWVENETQIDAVTGVSGSGPAYVFHLVEAMALAGMREGLSEAVAMQLARATVEGAGELLFQSHETAATLRQNVTSPGGTTAAALNVLMDDATGLPPLLAKAVHAARKRAEELAG
ncbi:MAG: pyrroline-5-carboxylate reductase [Pseudomonadota bacterium]